jgi:hypothetical protein
MSKPQDGFVSRVLNRPRGPSGSNLRFDPGSPPSSRKKKALFPGQTVVAAQGGMPPLAQLVHLVSAKMRRKSFHI